MKDSFIYKRKNKLYIKYYIRPLKIYKYTINLFIYNQESICILSRIFMERNIKRIIFFKECE